MLRRINNKFSGKTVLRLRGWASADVVLRFSFLDIRVNNVFFECQRSASHVSSPNAKDFGGTLCRTFQISTVFASGVSLLTLFLLSRFFFFSYLLSLYVVKRMGGILFTTLS